MGLRHWITPASVLVLAVTSVQAQTIVKDNTSPVSVASINPYQTDFDAINGMQVNWTLTSGGGSAAWGALGGGVYGVWTDDFKLWQDGSNDTFDTKWNLWAQNLVSFSLNALLGNAVFDIVSTDPLNSTPGSASGKVFDWSPNISNTTVTYSNPVGVSPVSPVGDLYGQLFVSFGQTSSESCLNGWTLYNHQCKQVTGYSCASGYTYQSSGPYAGECTKFKNTTCPSGWNLVTSGGHSGECSKYYSGSWHYQGATDNYYTQTPTKIYDYQSPIITYTPIVFGTSAYCNDGYDPSYQKNYQHSQDIDNTKCAAYFYQDMDNMTPLDSPGNPQDVVPEPMTMSLLATGLAGMAAARRRRKK
jgi:hypothetical protein